MTIKSMVSYLFLVVILSGVLGCVTTPEGTEFKDLRNIVLSGFVTTNKWPVVVECVAGRVSTVMPNHIPSFIDKRGIKLYSFTTTVDQLPTGCMTGVDGLTAKDGNFFNRQMVDLLIRQEITNPYGTKRMSKTGIYTGNLNDAVCATQAWNRYRRVDRVYAQGCYRKYVENGVTYPYSHLMLVGSVIDVTLRPH